MVFSKTQEKAITENGQNILVSAGAGSGKTAVLTERIFRLVKAGTPISKFLVLTFTDAASAEMKERVRQAILADESLKDKAAEIENSHIETFDAFCLFLVKKYAFDLGLSPDIKVLDGSVLSIQRNKIIQAKFNELLTNKDDVFEKMVYELCVNDTGNISFVVNNIANLSDLQINKYEFLNTFVDTYFNKAKLDKCIDELYHEFIDKYQYIYNKATELEDSDDATAIQDMLDTLICSKNYDEMYQKMQAASFPRKPKTKTSDKEFRDLLKAQFDSISVSKLDFGPSNEIINSYLNKIDFVKKLIEITIDVEHELDNFKSANSAYSFGDIARFAIEALSNEKIVKEMSESFDYILVDEYQDTSDIQETVVSRLGRNNIYMVGDVKQSIYRFRNANCAIFQDKYENYKKGNGGLEIDLNQSFRSRKEVVSIVNEIFLNLMKKEFNPIDYSNGHNFEFGQETYNKFIDDKEDYNLKVLTYTREKGEICAEKEAEIIAKDIIYKINNHYKICNPKAGTFLDATFKDFAIIADRGTNFHIFKKVFNKYGIPLNVTTKEKVSATEISIVTRNLLILYYIERDNLQNSLFDLYKHAFISIARSFLMGMKDPDIFQYVKDNLIEHSPVLEKIINVVKEYRYSSLYEVINALYNEFDLYRKIITIGDFNANTHKAEIFLDLAKSMDDIGFGVEDFVNYFNDLDSYGVDIETSASDASEDSVSIMTIHHSKGLEYPICYFPLLGTAFNRQDIKSSFLTHKKYGVVLPNTRDYPYNCLFNHLIKKDVIRDDFEEKLRVLYVAITRAKERVILIVEDKEKEKDIFDLTQVDNFRDILRYIGIINKYRTELKADDDIKLSIEEKTPKKVKIEKKSILVPTKEIIHHRASRRKSIDTEDNILQFGIELHYLLEVVDYETKDSSFITHPGLKRYVDNVLNCELFKGVKNSQLYHEYEFFDEESDTNGVIDCLIEKDDEMIIVDFKLKSIDNDTYVKQLHTYQNYIMKVTSKCVRMFLISAFTGECKEIE